MKPVGALVIFSVALAGCADMRGTVRVEQAAAGRPYDFVVHVKNSAEIGYRSLRRSRWHGSGACKAVLPCRARHRTGKNHYRDLWNYEQQTRLCRFCKLRDRFAENREGGLRCQCTQCAVRSDYCRRLTADLNSLYSPAVARHDAMRNRATIASFRIVAAEAGGVAAHAGARGDQGWLNQAHSRQCEHDYNGFPHRASLRAVTQRNTTLSRRDYSAAEHFSR
jgi:hypothetical protein